MKDRNGWLYRWADRHPDAAKVLVLGILLWIILGPIVALDVIARAWAVPGVVAVCAGLMLIWLGAWVKVLWLRRREIRGLFR